ncbi:hypothetical protein K9L16_03595 [Candidatus Pacearchaeota archaeon]|nr:hypothetical protein [Candidatus Pacearchaeota archaeon]
MEIQIRNSYNSFQEALDRISKINKINNFWLIHQHPTKENYFQSTQETKSINKRNLLRLLSKGWKKSGRLYLSSFVNDMGGSMGEKAQLPQIAFQSNSEQDIIKRLGEAKETLNQTYSEIQDFLNLTGKFPSKDEQLGYLFFNNTNELNFIGSFVLSDLENQRWYTILRKNNDIKNPKVDRGFLEKSGVGAGQIPLLFSTGIKVRLNPGTYEVIKTEN